MADRAQRYVDPRATTVPWRRSSIMGYMRHDHALERIASLGEQPLTGLKPVFGDPIRCFISNGLFLGLVVDGVVANIWGPRSSLSRLGTPIYDLSSAQWHIGNYHLS